MTTETISPEKQKAIQELLSSPGMPVFMLRNKDIDIVCPKEMIEEKYRDKLDAIEEKYQNDNPNAGAIPKVILRSIEYPDLSFAAEITKSSTFSLFIESHNQIAGKLIELFMDAPDVSHLLSLGVYCRERLNSYLFIYSWTSALTHRDDTKNIELPSITENLPAKFFPKVALNNSRKMIYMAELDRPIVKLRVETAVNNVSDELKLNYFREDIAINQHHYHWHIIYPYYGPMKVVNKDRRGELFYYMHNQALRRMDIDRCCLGIPPVEPLQMRFGLTGGEGYFPKMDTSLGSRYNPGRPDNAEISEALVGNSLVSPDTIRVWLERLTTSITAGYILLPNDERVPLTPETGIDLVANLLEASQQSPNRGYYGNAHNQGHIIISRCSDPMASNNEEPGVMADVTTAMRDPIFYRWHKAIDNICREHKITLPVYQPKDLNCEQISIDSVTLTKNDQVTDILETFWEWDDINCSRGLDFKSSTPIYVRFKHLNHEEWVTKIQVTNKLATETKVYVRIWYVPVNDFNGRNIGLGRQSLLALEMDKYVATLTPGTQTLVRRSEETTNTIPFKRSFPSAFGDGPVADPNEEAAYCLCGWPHHMYLPIGTMDGAPFEVFVMLTPYERDRVDGEDTGSLYCGLRNKKYPDKRAMGYPFDRLFASKYGTLQDLCNSFPNMKSTRVNIVHKNEERKGKYLLGEL